MVLLLKIEEIKLKNDFLNLNKNKVTETFLSNIKTDLHNFSVLLNRQMNGPSKSDSAFLSRIKGSWKTNKPGKIRMFSDELSKIEYEGSIKITDYDTSSFRFIDETFNSKSKKPIHHITAFLITKPNSVNTYLASHSMNGISVAKCTIEGDILTLGITKLMDGKAMNMLKNNNDAEVNRIIFRK